MDNRKMSLNGGVSYDILAGGVTAPVGTDFNSFFRPIATVTQGPSVARPSNVESDSDRQI